MSKTTKDDLIRQVAETTGYSRYRTEKFVDATVRAMSEAILREGLILKGLGTFELHTAPPRNYRNPVTGNPMMVPERQKIKFRASKPLLDAANRQ